MKKINVYTQLKKSSTWTGLTAQKKKPVKQCIDFTDNRTEAAIQRTNDTIQRAIIGNINCPNIGSAMAIGNHIHGRLEADYLLNGNPNPAHPTWIRGIEFQTPTGQIPDISLRTPGMGLVRSVGEIKPAGQLGAGTAQIAAHLANIPANGLNAAHPVVNDPVWAAGAAFPVTDLDPAAVSPTGNVNVWQAPGVNGLYLYNG